MLGPLTYGALSQVTGADNWWQAGGAPTPTAVYQPIGAASLAASYVNLVNPGTFDAAPGIAPSWDAMNGWDFDGSTQYLTTGIVPDGGYSILFRFTNAGTTTNEMLGGTYGSIANRWGIYTKTASRTYYVNYNLAQAVISVAYASGVLALAGKSGYYNGTLDATVSAGVVSTALGIFLGAVNNSGGPAFHFPGNIQTVAIYPSNTNHATWVPAVSTEMAAL